MPVARYDDGFWPYHPPKHHWYKGNGKGKGGKGAGKKKKYVKAREQRYIFRALNIDEVNNEFVGLSPKAPSNWDIEVEDAVCENVPSRFIHCTYNLYVALYYANAFDAKNSCKRIVVIDTEKVENHGNKVIDVVAEYGIDGKLGNYANSHRIVLIEGAIPRNAVVHYFDTEFIQVPQMGKGDDDTSNSRGFRVKQHGNLGV